MPVELVAQSENFNRDNEFEIYPDNARTVALFIDMLTQWRVGVNGATGLDYNVIPMLFKLRRVKKKHRNDVFDGLKVMERAALEAIKTK